MLVNIYFFFWQIDDNNFCEYYLNNIFLWFILARKVWMAKNLWSIKLRSIRMWGWKITKKYLTITDSKEPETFLKSFDIPKIVWKIFLRPKCLIAIANKFLSYYWTDNIAYEHVKATTQSAYDEKVTYDGQKWVKRGLKNT